MYKLRKLQTFDVEIVICFGVYIAYISYGLWALYDVRDKVLEISKHDFQPGWTFLNRLRDNTSDELATFIKYLLSVWPWYVVHVGVSLLVRRYSPQRQSIAQAAVCFGALLYLMQPLPLLVLTALLFSYHVALQFGSKILIWVLSALWILIITAIKNDDFWYSTLGHTQYIFVMLTVSWSMLRCTSFALNRINDKAVDSDGQAEMTYALQYYLGYTLYLPCLFYGPFLSYQRYLAHLKPDQQSQPLVKLIVTLAWQLLRVAFWLFVLQLALHFIYIHYMSYDYQAVALLGSPFTQYAVVYFMGQFFFIFYIICYGLGIALAQFDGLDPPKRPRCIGRVHFYSDMWKYFDQGLYEFLFRHIYVELCSRRSPFAQKLFATVATFAFAVVWHGCYMYVFVWSVLNLACVVAEKYFLAATSSRLYVKWTTRHLGVRGGQRLRALLATQLFIPAAFSNVYFFGGMEVGNYLMRSAYMSGFGNYIALTMCSYCFFQCSEVILNLSKTDSSCKHKNILDQSNGSNKKIS